MLTVRGVDNLDKITAQVEKLLAREVSTRLRLSAHFVHKSLHSHTPVFTGTAVRNYVWTVSAPYSGPTLDPVESCETGETSKMGLGNEPRRRANEALSTQTLKTLDFNAPYQTYYVTNNAYHIMELESGLLPTPETSRSPFGIFSVTEENLQLNLSAILHGRFL